MAIPAKQFSQKIVQFKISEATWSAPLNTLEMLRKPLGTPYWINKKKR
jgi:hypothetical protein